MSRAALAVQPASSESFRFSNALMAATPESLGEALEAVADEQLPIVQRGAIYAGLRRVRLAIDRTLRPVTYEIQRAMSEAGATEWGAIRLGWRSVDVRWPVNDEGNWGDAGVQQQLEAWRADAHTRPFVRAIPEHYEIDTKALGEAVHLGDPDAIALWTALKDQRLRTDEGQTATLTLREER